VDLLVAALSAALGFADLPALLPQARDAALRFAPKAVLVELRVSIEDADPRPVFAFFDGESEQAKDLFVEVSVKSGAPSVRLLRELKRDDRPPALDLSRAVSWTTLRFPSGQAAIRWEPLRLRARSDGAPCWRAKVKDVGPVYFDGRSGEPSAACADPFKAR
jgi:hypothetical protein